MIFDKDDILGNLYGMLEDCELNNIATGKAKGNWQDEIDALRLAIYHIEAYQKALKELK